MGLDLLKIFFSRTTRPILIRLAQIILGRKGFKLFQGRGLSLSKGRYFLKSSSPEPAGQIQSNLVQMILG
jgi:hypothetical protein